MQFQDIRGLILQSVAVSPDGHDTLQKVGLVDKMGKDGRKHEMQRDAWVKYMASRESVQAVESYKWPFSATNWENCMGFLSLHRDCEYAAKTFMACAVAGENVMRTLQFSRNIQSVSSFECIELIAAITRMYPLNLEIKLLGCLIMAKLYQNCRETMSYDTGVYREHLRFASTLLCSGTRNATTVCYPLYLIIAIEDKCRNAVQLYLEETGRDIVTMAFGAQDEFHLGQNNVYIYTSFSVTCLRNWRPLLPLGMTGARLPLDIILDYMQQNYSTLEYIDLWWIQLSHLTTNESLDLRVSHRKMSSVFAILNAIVGRTAPTTTEVVKSFLWGFLHTCISLPENFENFKAVFTIEFLLTSLSYFTSDSDELRRLQKWILSDCIRDICRMVRLLTEGSNSSNRRRLRDAGGLAVLMNTMSHLYRQDGGQEDGGGRAVCIGILSDIVRSVENTDN